MSWALALRSDFTPRSDITITVKASTMQCLSGSQPMQARITQRSNKPCRAVRVHSAKADTSICSCSRREILSAALIPANVALLHQLPARAEGASAVEESAVVEAATPAAQVASNASAALNPSHKQVGSSGAMGLLLSPLLAVRPSKLLTQQSANTVHMCSSAQLKPFVYWCTAYYVKQHNGMS